ncbi:hypothetical protein KCU78_g3595, partial [Aureobasidium melanogenum]
MADPQATALRSDSDYLLRIKTDTKELSSKQHEAQRKIDAIRAQIYREGPTAILEARMENELAEQKSICIRSDIAVSIIGASIEDLIRTSRKPPCVTAVRDVLGSIDYLDNEVSLEAVGLVLAVQMGSTAESFTDVFEDLESASKSTSKDPGLRAAKILQETQLAVRELATTPLHRILARQDASRLAYRLEQQREQHRILASTINLPSSRRKREDDYPPQALNPSTLDNQHLHQVNQSSKAPDMHDYLDELLDRVPQDRILEALQNLDPILRSGGDGCWSEKVKKKGDQTQGLSGHRGLTGSDRGHIKKLVINLQNKIEGLLDDVRDPEDAVDGGGGHEDRRKSGQLSINRSSDSKKRSTSASDDETNIKRRCS